MFAVYFKGDYMWRFDTMQEAETFISIEMTQMEHAGSKAEDWEVREYGKEVCKWKMHSNYRFDYENKMIICSECGYRVSIGKFVKGLKAMGLC